MSVKEAQEIMTNGIQIHKNLNQITMQSTNVSSYVYTCI